MATTFLKRTLVLYVLMTFVGGCKEQAPRFSFVTNGRLGYEMNGREYNRECRIVYSSSIINHIRVEARHEYTDYVYSSFTLSFPPEEGDYIPQVNTITPTSHVHNIISDFGTGRHFLLDSTLFQNSISVGYIDLDTITRIGKIAGSFAIEFTQDRDHGNHCFIDHTEGDTTYMLKGWFTGDIADTH
ncbi:MAG: hypothetical protein JXR19_06645 [Bacteroidia bacterium]